MGDNDIRREILYRMTDKLSEEQLGELEQVLNLVLYDYIIERKSTELTVYDDSDFTLIKNFIGSKLVEGCSQNTAKYYKEQVTQMVQKINKPIKDITTDDIRHHLALWRAERGVTISTLDNMRRAYSSFFAWLTAEGIIKDNPMTRISAFKKGKRQIKPFTEAELERICMATENKRDRALVEFLYSTGCRVTECADITMNDIDFRRGSVFINHGKGDKEREVYISDKCMVHLQEYLESRTDNDIALWIGKRGKLTKDGIENIIRELGKKTGIHAHPHRFRHTFATNLIKRGAEVQTVQKLLGHEDIGTTMIYVEINQSDVEHTHRKLMA